MESPKLHRYDDQYGDSYDSYYDESMESRGWWDWSAYSENGKYIDKGLEMPETLQDFLGHINNPDDVLYWMKKYKFNLILCSCFCNYHGDGPLIKYLKIPNVEIRKYCEEDSNSEEDYSHILWDNDIITNCKDLDNTMHAFYVVHNEENLVESKIFAMNGDYYLIPDDALL